MSYFDDDKEVIKTYIDGSYRMSKNPMKTNKVCFEFVWKDGSGYPVIGVCITKEERIRLSYSGRFSSSGVSTKSETGDSIPKAANEPIMICFDKSDTSNLNITAIKGTK